MHEKIYKFKLKGFPSEAEFKAMPFGRRIEWFQKIEQFKKEAKVAGVSQKRQPYAKAIREFVKLYRPTEYFTSFYSSPDYWDDGFEVWYKD
jgi:hypothetical protein